MHTYTYTCTYFLRVVFVLFFGRGGEGGERQDLSAELWAAWASAGAALILIRCTGGG